MAKTKETAALCVTWLAALTGHCNAQTEPAEGSRAGKAEATARTALQRIVSLKSYRCRTDYHWCTPLMQPLRKEPAPTAPILDEWTESTHADGVTVWITGHQDGAWTQKLWAQIEEHERSIARARLLRSPPADLPTQAASLASLRSALLEARGEAVLEDHGTWFARNDEDWERRRIPTGDHLTDPQHLARQLLDLASNADWSSSLEERGRRPVRVLSTRLHEAEAHALIRTQALTDLGRRGKRSRMGTLLVREGGKTMLSPMLSSFSAPFSGWVQVQIVFDPSTKQVLTIQCDLRSATIVKLATMRKITVPDDQPTSRITMHLRQHDAAKVVEDDRRK